MMRYFSFQWHITDNCDQRCKHCYIFSGSNHVPVSMKYSDIETVFENCMNFCETFGRIPYFYITGGDPILHPQFWKLLEILNSNHIAFSILGNPFHIDDRTCERLKLLGCEKYQLSIDGLKNTHDFFRKSGSFDETLAKISCINNAGICSVIMSTVSKQNIHEIPDVIDVAVEHEAEVYSFARYVPTGGEITSISPNEYRDFLRVCDEKFRQYESRNCKTYFDRKDHLWTLYEYETGRFTIPKEHDPEKIYGGCNCGNAHITILPNGDVYACRRVHESKVGNANVDRLIHLWVDNMENYRDYKKFVKCSKCDLLSYCRGCPAVSKGTYGNFYAQDPQCWKEI